MSLPPSRPSNDSYDDSTADPEDSLLPGVRKIAKTYKKDQWIKLGLGVWAVFATLVVVIMAILFSKNQSSVSDSFPPSGKRNAVFMVSDGMGPASLALTRSYMQHVSGNLPWGETLTLDKHLIGTSRTRSSNSLVTDSAAGATAFSCAYKSYNGAISVLPDGSPCGTVLEAAKLAGYMTGLVVTTRITDATPACFSAHVNLRSEEDRIAEQQLGDYPLGRMVDLMLGGGRCHFLPNSTEGSCRGDNRDLIKEAQEKYGFTYINDRKSFDALRKSNTISLPLLGLFAPTDIPFDIDRKDEIYPSLEEMAELALNTLEAATKNSDKGFFLMVEGSRIDHAGHGNDPAAQVHEVLAYDKTFSKIHDWVSHNHAVLVSTSDHETGGLALARQLDNSSYPSYLWLPQVLGNASSSSEYLGSLYRNFEGSSNKQKKFLLQTVLKEGLGIEDAADWEIQNLMEHKGYSDPVLADMISRRAQIGWSTHGHSGVDVNIYGSKGTERLYGNHENTEIGAFLADYLDLDLEKVTTRLRDEGVDSKGTDVQYAWMGKSLKELKADEKETGYYDTEHIDVYHGVFRKT
ncbi:alkaline-phosphatase-like protein [Geopyxis carbonaria]|nr:alkaline-phosphatase-like protein [Geopyxis carbonaria]